MREMRGFGKGSLPRLRRNRPSKGLFAEGAGTLVLMRWVSWNGRTYLFDLRRDRKEAELLSGQRPWVSCGPTTACGA
jgi:hypothetical protein